MVSCYRHLRWGHSGDNWQSNNNTLLLTKVPGSHQSSCFELYCSKGTTAHISITVLYRRVWLPPPPKSSELHSLILPLPSPETRYTESLSTSIFLCPLAKRLFSQEMLGKSICNVDFYFNYHKINIFQYFNNLGNHIVLSFTMEYT